MAATEPAGDSGATWSKRFTTAVAAEIRRVRLDRGDSTKDVADACQALGHKIHRSVLANLETGHRDVITIPELVVIAAALQVSPMELVTNWGRSSRVEILPHSTVPADRALEWLDGTLDDTEVIRGEPVHVVTNYTASLALQLIRAHAQATHDVQTRFKELFERAHQTLADQREKSFALTIAARRFVEVRRELLQAGFEAPEVADDLESLMKGEWPPHFGPMIDRWQPEWMAAEGEGAS